MRDICPGSGEFIPSRGAVVCICGRHWTPYDSHGEPLFFVPLHTSEGPVTMLRVRRGLDRAYETKQSRQRVRESAARDVQRRWLG